MCELRVSQRLFIINEAYNMYAINQIKHIKFIVLMEDKTDRCILYIFSFFLKANIGPIYQSNLSCQ